MAYYRIHILDGRSRIIGGLDLECEDDQSACKEAAHLFPDNEWELWRGERRIHCPLAEMRTEARPD
ncbi:MAG TPA: hypothetical protein VMU31_11925 [Rhizomicrobium sp.]|nr:hypothetical protein [Rhizomicrobium sp.]